MTIGHSTIPRESFTRVLNEARVDCLVDIRSFPGSRHTPQFNQEAMTEYLPAAGIAYHHLPLLGGRRGKQATAELGLNTGWKNASFKNFADYTLTDDFAQGLTQLLDLTAHHSRCCLCCAEAVPWKCHRMIVSHHLVMQGHEVDHIMPPNVLKPHDRTWGVIPVFSLDGHVVFP